LDVFEKVQETRPEIEGADESLAAARMLLVKEIQAERKPARSRAARRPWLVAASIVGAVAAVTAGVLVVTNLTAPVEAPIIEAVPTREPDATITRTPAPVPVASTGPEVLQGAATAAAGFVSPVLAPGQYLRRSWTEEAMGVYDSSIGSWGEPGYSGSRGTATSAWVIRRSGAEYAPADLTASWYREWSAPEVLRVFGDEAEAQMPLNSMLAAYGNGQPLYASEAPSLPESGGEDILWYFDNMPRDPGAMIAWIRERQGPDASGWLEGKVGWLLIALLSYNVGDPELRSAMYEALSLLPGSTVGDEQNGRRTVTFDSHLGAPDAAETSLSRFTITIEMATGIVTETTTTTEVGEGMIPADVPNTHVTYEMSVVDALP
jgi:hypothetical protein